MKRFGFCTNAFPAWDLDNLIADYLPRFKALHKAVGDRALALDLQLGAGIVEELPKRGGEFAQALAENDLMVGSINLFPLCDFQADVVKTKVYFPNWLEEERHRLTLIAAEWVAQELKPQKAFSISTLAGCYHPEGPTPQDIFPKLGNAYSSFADKLVQLKSDTGCHIVLCLEPEPFTSLQKIQDSLDLWQHFTSDASRAHLGLNLDCCHFSVMGEKPLDGWRVFQEAGIPVPKIHASTALKLQGPLNEDQMVFLEEMNEPRFLHQTSLIKNSTITHHNDLPEAFKNLENCEELICHFHMPLFLKDESNNFSTTAPDTEAVLAEAIKQEDIEIYAETYTWTVLGKQFAANADEGISKELNYLKELLS